MKIGTIIYAEDPITINANKASIRLVVTNTGDRPIQVGSHYHFFECNFALQFDREAAFGRHLDIPAGTAVRFDPGEETEVQLVIYSGKQKIMGFNKMTMGEATDPEIRAAALAAVHRREEEERECQR